MGLAKEKTTIYLDAEDYRRLKQIARARKRPAAALVREAVAEYTLRHAPRRRARSVGAFRSGRRDLGTRAEQLLSGFGDEA
ncbi:MAG: ribbon-helix-helix protein, CopG family [Vicinamibacterales bacterium]